MSIVHMVGCLAFAFMIPLCTSLAMTIWNDVLLYCCLISIFRYIRSTIMFISQGILLSLVLASLARVRCRRLAELTQDNCPPRSCRSFLELIGSASGLIISLMPEVSRTEQLGFSNAGVHRRGPVQPSFCCLRN